MLFECVMLLIDRPDVFVAKSSSGSKVADGKVVGSTFHCGTSLPVWDRFDGSSVDFVVSITNGLSSNRWEEADNFIELEIPNGSTSSADVPLTLLFSVSSGAKTSANVLNMVRLIHLNETLPMCSVETDDSKKKAKGISVVFLFKRQERQMMIMPARTTSTPPHIIFLSSHSDVGWSVRVCVFPVARSLVPSFIRLHSLHTTRRRSRKKKRRQRTTLKNMSMSWYR